MQNIIIDPIMRTKFRKTIQNQIDKPFNKNNFKQTNNDFKRDMLCLNENILFEDNNGIKVWGDKKGVILFYSL